MTGWYFLWISLFGWFAWEYHEELILGDLALKEFISRIPFFYQQDFNSVPWLVMIFPFFFFLAVVARITEITLDPNKIARRSLMWSVKSLFMYPLTNLFFICLLLLMLNGPSMSAILTDKIFVIIFFGLLTFFAIFLLGCWKKDTYFRENSIPWYQPQWPGGVRIIFVAIFLMLLVVMSPFAFFTNPLFHVPGVSPKALAIVVKLIVFVVEEYTHVVLAAMLIYNLTRTEIIQLAKSTFSRKFVGIFVMYGVTYLWLLAIVIPIVGLASYSYIYLVPQIEVSAEYFGTDLSKFRAFVHFLISIREYWNILLWLPIAVFGFLWTGKFTFELHKHNIIKIT